MVTGVLARHVFCSTSVATPSGAAHPHARTEYLCPPDSSLIHKSRDFAPSWVTQDKFGTATPIARHRIACWLICRPFCPFDLLSFTALEMCMPLLQYLGVSLPLTLHHALQALHQRHTTICTAPIADLRETTFGLKMQCRLLSAAMAQRDLFT